MRRSDPRTTTRILLFLVIYVFVTGILVLALRSVILEDRVAENAELGSRIPLLDQQLSERTAQEDEIIRELIAVAGAQDFEEAYRDIRDSIDRLEVEIGEAEERATIERQLRLDAERDLDDVYVKVQALELETMRLQANLASCADRLSVCTNATVSC